MAITFTQKLYPLVGQPVEGLKSIIDAEIFNDDGKMKYNDWSVLSMKPAFFTETVIHNNLTSVNTVQESDHVKINHVFADGGEFLLKHCLMTGWHQHDMPDDVEMTDVSSNYTWFTSEQSLSIQMYKIDGTDGDGFGSGNDRGMVAMGEFMHRRRKLQIEVSDVDNPHYQEWLTHYKAAIAAGKCSKSLLHESDPDHADEPAWAYDVDLASEYNNPVLAPEE
jgi:hypothetical protein